MWSSHLQTENYHIIEFNAWETDYSDDPFIVLVEELLESISGNQGATSKELDDAKKKLNALWKSSLISLGSGVVKHATAGLIDVERILEMSREAESSIEKRRSVYQEVKKSFQEFKETLAEVASLQSQASDDKPIIIMIDELDRCRPTYAVELLEVSKHLFAVKNLIFVMAVNCSQLEYSVKSLYGSGFDAEGYLKRFFDLKFQLPVPDRKKFIEHLLIDSQMFYYSKQTNNRAFANEFKICKEFLFSFSEHSTISLRTLTQAIYHLGLVFASLQSNHTPFVFTTVVLLIIRTIHADAYRKFVRGKISDLQLIEEVSSLSSVRDWKKIEHIVDVEAIVILSYFERSTTGTNLNDKPKTPLLNLYEKFVNPKHTIDNSSKLDIDLYYAQRVPKALNQTRQNFLNQGLETIGYKLSVDRIELFSQEYSALNKSSN